MIASMVVCTTRVRIKAESKSGEASPLRWFQVQARARSLYLNPVMSDIKFQHLPQSVGFLRSIIHKFVQKVAQNQLGMHFVGRMYFVGLPRISGQGYPVSLALKF